MSRGEAMMAEMIKSMHELAIDLNNHSEVADHLLCKNNSITEKLIVMKEYNQAVSAIDSCQAPGNRAELVASLQQESRQVQELKEEKRLLKHTVDEMLLLFENVMVKHRRALEDFKRSEKMLELLDKLREPENKNDHSMLAKLAAFSHACIEKATADGLRNTEIIARLSTENSTLRTLLNLTPTQISPDVINLQNSTANDDENLNQTFNGDSGETGNST